MKRFILSLCIAVSLPLIGGRTAVGQIDREWELKTAYLYNFGQYVEWPKDAIADEFVIGVLGKDPFGPHLNKLAAKTVQGKKIVIRRFQSAKDYTPCQILFVSALPDESADEKTVQERVKAALAKTAGSPVLLVGDGAGLGQTGVMISFYIEENKLKLEINRDAAIRAGLKISSTLLELKIVKLVTGGGQ